MKHLVFLILLLIAAPLQQGFCQDQDATLQVSLRANGTASVVLEGRFKASDDQIKKSMAALMGGTMRRCDSEIELEPDDGEYILQHPSPKLPLCSVGALYDDACVRAGLLRNASINPAPVIDLLRTGGVVTGLGVHVSCRMAPYVQFSSPQSNVNPTPASFSADYSLQGSQPLPAPILCTFGYRLQDLLPAIALFGLLFLLPLSLVLWMRHKALTTGGADPTTVWFRYSRFLQWTTISFTFIWVPCILLIQPTRIVDFWLVRPGAGIRMGVLECLLVLPPLLIQVVSTWLSYPVFVRVRGSERTRRELVWQSFLVLAKTTLPVGFGVTGLFFYTQQPRLSILFLGLACGLPSLFNQLILRSQNTTIEALTTGELRDRVFALAQNAGVKVSQLFFLKTGKDNVANAFAVRGNVVVLTDYLLQHLSRREVDAVVAHELAHLRHRHPERLGRVGMFTTVIPILASALWAWHSHSTSPVRYFLIPVFIVAGMMALFYRSRQFEAVADRDAAALTGDPEALVTGLLKLKQLNLTPLEWGKWEGRFLTHPSTLRRAEALARQGGIPQERLQEILERSETEADHYALPPTIGKADGGYNSRWKAGQILLKGWLLIAAKVLPPTVVASTAYAAALHGAQLRSIYLLGLLISCACYLLALYAISPIGWNGLSARLQEKLGQVEAVIANGGGSFVGLASGFQPRLYGSFPDWDMGFLYLHPDRLCYIGEQARFGLERAQVHSSVIGPGLPGWFQARRVYITWQNEETGQQHTLSLRPSGAGWGRRRKRAVDDLACHICSWRAGKLTALPQCVPYSAATTFLPPPVFGEITSVSPTMLRTVRVALLTMKIPTLVAAAVAMAVGLPFRFAEGGEGCYVVGSAILLTLLQVAPYWSYREPSAPSTLPSPPSK